MMLPLYEVALQVVVALVMDLVETALPEEVTAHLWPGQNKHPERRNRQMMVVVAATVEMMTATDPSLRRPVPEVVDRGRSVKARR